MCLTLTYALYRKLWTNTTNVYNAVDALSVQPSSSSYLVHKRIYVYVYIDVLILTRTKDAPMEF